MNTTATRVPASRKQKIAQRVAGQSARRNQGHEYIYLIVDKTPHMAKALGKISLDFETQKEAVQHAIELAASRK